MFCFFISDFALGSVCSPCCRLGQCLAYTFLTLRHPVVSIMCKVFTVLF